MTAIVLNGKTYTSIGFDSNGVSVFSEQSGGVPSSFSKLTDKVNLGTGSANSNVKWKLAMPIVATVADEFARVGDLLRTYHVQIEVTIPPGSPAAERTDLETRISDLVATAEFSASIQTLAQAS